MSIHNGRLVLAPRDPAWAPNPSAPNPNALTTALAAALAAAGLLGPALGPGADAYAAGPGFLELVAFTGCAVQVAVTPDVGGDRPFCHIRVVGPWAEPRLLCGRNTRPPRCPACRAQLRDWRYALGATPRATGPLPCPACGGPAAASAWDWKDTGGWARLSVWIEEVFPGEATPTDALMALLGEATGTPWRHFYIQD